MKMTKISSLPIDPETYDTEHYDKFDYANSGSIMTDKERRFIHGLIRFYEPNNILELGVHSGGGTINILNAVNAKDCILVSIDKAVEIVMNGKRMKVGENAFAQFPNLPQGRWRLITGKDPSEVMENLNLKFDFVLLDTAHLHPVEVLNFLSVLPWLNDNAIVVMHDTTNYLDFNLTQLAPRLLMVSVCAQRVEPTTPGWSGYPNIVAFQVTGDTRKYIQNVFDVLMFPWEFFPRNDVKNVHKLVQKFYSPQNIAAFEMAMKMNNYVYMLKSIKTPEFTQIWSSLREDTVFYGAGMRMANLLECIKCNPDLQFKFAIWDINAENIGKIAEHAVVKPDFKTPANPGQIMIIMIDDALITNSIRSQFELLGYTVFHKMEELLNFVVTVK